MCFLFSDQSSFIRDEHVDRENPNIIRELHDQTPEKIFIWASILGNQIDEHY